VIIGSNNLGGGGGEDSHQILDIHVTLSPKHHRKNIKVNVDIKTGGDGE